MADKRWRCTKPNECEENCQINSYLEPTGCIYSDEETIQTDAKIWEEINE